MWLPWSVPQLESEDGSDVFLDGVLSYPACPSSSKSFHQLCPTFDAMDFAFLFVAYDQMLPSFHCCVTHWANRGEVDVQKM